MSVGSSYSTVKRAITDVLSDRGGLAEVSVSYQAPVAGEDVTGPTGAADAIWLHDADGEYDNVVICGLPLRLEERYDLVLVVQSLQPDSLGTQEVADTRVDEMLFEVLDALATDPTFGVDDFDYLQVTRGRFRRVTGFLPTGSGHGARAELRLEVECRIAF